MPHFFQHVLVDQFQQDDAMVLVIGQFSDLKHYPYQDNQRSLSSRVLCQWHVSQGAHF